MNGVTKVDQHLGDTTHSAAADSHEVNRVDPAHAVAAIRCDPSLVDRAIELSATVGHGAAVLSSTGVGLGGTFGYHAALRANSMQDAASSSAA